jgi:hypothetical protein
LIRKMGGALAISISVTMMTPRPTIADAPFGVAACSPIDLAKRR